MQTIFLDLANIDQLPNLASTSSVLTIGNFDGVHLGHQAMIKQLQVVAEQNNLSTMVMIFEPQPREYFATLKSEPESAPARLTSLTEKLHLLDQFNIDAVVVAKFDDDFRSLSAKEFADMLTQRLNVSALVLGDDFKFGHDRTGDSEFLRQYGLNVTKLQTITTGSTTTTEDIDDDIKDVKSDERISSTKIRNLLDAGHLKQANLLLGHEYSIIGNVFHGDKIGRTLDFPTANIELNRIRPALHGVYAVDVVMLDDKGNLIPDAFDSLAEEQKTGIKGLRPYSLFGTANVGKRPSIDKPHHWRLEVFFPEFKGDLYNKTLQVRFLHFLHAERKYEDLDALKKGIEQDVQDLTAWRDAQSR